MTIKAIQDEIAAKLNDSEALVQGGCKAFAEDSRDVYDKAQQWTSGGRVALVVVTPRLQRNGSTLDGEGFPVDAPIYIRCIETAPIAPHSPAIRALDAAAIVAAELDGETLSVSPVGNLLFDSIEQTADQQRKVFTATVRFFYSFTLT